MALAVFSRGFAYALGVFIVGCVLGTIREVVVGPALGSTTALAIELPIMLAASAFVAHRQIARRLPPFAAVERLNSGAVGLVVLILLEDVLTRLVRGNSILDHWATQTGVQLSLTIAGLFGFLIAPLIVGAGRARPASGDAGSTDMPEQGRRA